MEGAAEEAAAAANRGAGGRADRGGGMITVACGATEVEDADAYPVAQPHHQGGDVGAAAAVEGEPVKSHAGGVRRVARRQDVELLRDEGEVLIDGRDVGRAGMDDEQ